MSASLYFRGNWSNPDLPPAPWGAHALSILQCPPLETPPHRHRRLPIGKSPSPDLQNIGQNPAPCVPARLIHEKSISGKSPPIPQIFISASSSPGMSSLQKIFLQAGCKPASFSAYAHPESSQTSCAAPSFAKAFAFRFWRLQHAFCQPHSNRNAIGTGFQTQSAAIRPGRAWQTAKCRHASRLCGPSKPAFQGRKIIRSKRQTISSISLISSSKSFSASFTGCGELMSTPAIFNSEIGSVLQPPDRKRL